MGEQLLFRRLVITSPGRHYGVEFHKGVNLIAGPIWTGKTSILSLLDYACGAKNAPSYPELSKCNDLFVECSVGGATLTIRRPLHTGTSKAIIYDTTIDHLVSSGDSVTGTEVSARQGGNGEPSVSSELLHRLGLSSIEVKTAPSREASELSPFTLRDLFLIIYVDQDRMGARRGFFEDHVFKAIKWRYAVEIVHGIFNQMAAVLGEALKSAETEAASIRQYLANVRDFLNRFHIPVVEDLEQRLRTLEADRALVQERIRGLRSESEARWGKDLSLVTRRESLDARRVEAVARASELRRTLTQLSRLRVQYDRERAQLEFLKESETLVGQLPIVRCPACLQTIEPEPRSDTCYVCHRHLPARESELSVDARLRGTRRRITDLESYIVELEDLLAHSEKAEHSLKDEIATVDRALRRIREATALPDTQAVLDASESLSLVARQLEQTNEHLALRRRARGEDSNLLAVDERVARLRDELQQLSAARRTPDGVVSALSDAFVTCLRDFKFPALHDARIDSTSFLPIIRGDGYGALSSKGAIALVMVAWHMALLRYALDQGSLFPRLLMLDSPLSHVGRDATDEAFKDQQIVDGFYAYLLGLHASRAGEFQVIIVDNRPPPRVRPLVCVEFTRDPAVGRFGLIDDETNAPPVV